ncbi:MAG: glycosyltransferase family 4 protein [Candidatus Yanofskybacteria bacterium]|nr:glycosyltransferase family 4 protein [Candidatus Yanofskybacteria bacterium]
MFNTDITIISDVGQLAMHRRVLILSTEYLPRIGGSELAAHHIAQSLDGISWDLVTAAVPGSPSIERIGAVTVYRVSSAPRFLLPLQLAWRAWLLMRRAPYDVMHAYQASYAGGAGWLLKAVARVRVPFLVTLQEGKELAQQSWFVRFTRRCIVRRANGVTAISSYLAEYARRMGCREVVVVPNGVDVAAMSGGSRVRNPDPTVLTVSRLVPKNNLEGVIRAFVRVCETIPQARLLIVGDGPLRRGLEELSSALGARERIEFMGSVPHERLPVVYSVADVFVRPSRSEGLGNVFLEAMAAGIPVVASPVGGIPDIVEHERTGLLCDPNDPDDIARQIVRAMTDAHLREQIVSHASALAAREYDWSVIARRMYAVYEGMWSSSRS